MNDIPEHELELDNGGILNPALVQKQHLTLEDVRVLVGLHAEKDNIMREAHDRIKEIEFVMQEVWGFGQDETKHTHRFRIPYPEQRGD